MVAIEIAILRVPKAEEYQGIPSGIPMQKHHLADQLKLPPSQRALRRAPHTLANINSGLNRRVLYREK